MLEIKKINVRQVKDNKTIIENLSLKIQDGKIEIIEGADSSVIDKLLDAVKDQTQYEITIGDVFLDKKSFKQLLSTKNQEKQLMEIVQNEFNLMCDNKFNLLNASKYNKNNILSYVATQVNQNKSIESNLDAMNNLSNMLFNKVSATELNPPNVYVDREESDFDINHFVLSGQLLNSNGASLIQFLGMIIGLGLIILTATKVYSATVNANSVSYSNSSSGIAATNVQGAIDKIYDTASEIMFNDAHGDGDLDSVIIYTNATATNINSSTISLVSESDAINYWLGGGKLPSSSVSLSSCDMELSYKTHHIKITPNSKTCAGKHIYIAPDAFTLMGKSNSGYVGTFVIC